MGWCWSANFITLFRTLRSFPCFCYQEYFHTSGALRSTVALESIYNALHRKRDIIGTGNRYHLFRCGHTLLMAYGTTFLNVSRCVYMIRLW